MEALDLALGLGMARRPVLLADAEVGEQVLEAVASAGEARRVDGAVVGERGGGPAVLLAGGRERGHDVVARDPPEGRAAEQVAGVVVEPRADLDLGPVGQAPVGDVGLPQLVGRRGLEAEPRAARPLARLGDDQARRVEDAPDGRGRRDRQALALEVPGDRHRAGIEPAGGELGAQRRRSARGPRPASARAAAWPARARLEGLEAALAVAAEQALEMLTTEPVLGRGGGHGQLCGDDLQDGDPMLRHAPDCHACPDSPVAYHLSPMSWTQTLPGTPIQTSRASPAPDRACTRRA